MASVPNVFSADRFDRCEAQRRRAARQALLPGEVIEATNPCAEQPLPPYGCCCLGSIDLTRMMEKSFTEQASFNFAQFKKLVHVAVRMLDNVLDVTAWPLPEQQLEAQNKRRIGLGFTGLGDTLVMLGLRYDSDEARAFGADICFDD